MQERKGTKAALLNCQFFVRLCGISGGPAPPGGQS